MSSGPSHQGLKRPKVQLLPDPTTSNLANLKRVKFLDPDFEAPVKQHASIDRAQMSAEYLKRKETLDKSL